MSIVNSGPTNEEPAVLSVCIPTYNNEKTIDRAIQSVLPQLTARHEFIVVDDCSSDETVARCRRYPEISRIVASGENAGLVANHNRCLSIATGKYVKYLHGDDELLPGALERFEECASDPRCPSLVFAKRQVISDDKDYVRNYTNLDLPLQPLDTFTDGETLVRRFLMRAQRKNVFGEPTAIAVHRAHALEVGGFNPNLPQLLDLDLCIRLLGRGGGAWIAQELSIRHHTAETTSAKNKAAGAGLFDDLLVLSALSRNHNFRLSTRLLAKLLLTRATSRRAVRLLLSDRSARHATSLLTQIAGKDRNQNSELIRELTKVKDVHE